MLLELPGNARGRKSVQSRGLTDALGSVGRVTDVASVLAVCGEIIDTECNGAVHEVVRIAAVRRRTRVCVLVCMKYNEY